MFGIPNLLKKAPQAISLTLLSNALNLAYDYFFQPPKWGIYVHGTTNTAFYVSSIIDLGIRSEAIVSDYQLEIGTFTSYNKVVRPEMFRVRVTHDGPEWERSEFIQQLQREIYNLTTFDVFCPEHTWENSTLVQYALDRSAKSGASMITVDLTFQQIRERPAEYSSENIEAPENKEVPATVRVTPVPNPTNIQATELPPL